MIKHFVGIVVLSILVIAVGIYGLKLSGTPSENKAVRYDEVRIRDFSNIKVAVESYYQDNYRLPASLDLLLAQRIKTTVPYLKKIPTDPKTKLEYTYTPLDATQYKICAEFETSSDAISKRKTGIDPSQVNDNLYGADDNSHPKGNYCFTRAISTYLQQQNDYGSSRNSSTLNNLPPPPPPTFSGEESTSSAF